MAALTKKSKHNIKKPWKKNLLVQVIAVLIAIIGISLSILDLLQNGSKIKPKQVVLQDDQLKSLFSEISILKQELELVKNQIKTLSKVSDETKLSIQLKGMDGTIRNLQDKFSGIENIILRDPQKSLEIPILRGDLNELKETFQSSISSLKDDIERAYTILIGTIVALLVAIIAPNISGLFKREKIQTQEDKL